MPSKLLYSIIFGFGIGVLLESFFDLSLDFLFLLSCFSFLLILFGSLFYKTKTHIYLLCVFLICFVLGSLRLLYKESLYKDAYVFKDNERVGIVGVVVDEVERSESSQKFVIKDLSSKTKIQITTELYPKVFYGDKVYVEGKIQIPDTFVSQNGRDFDYKKYLLKDEISYTVSFADIEKMGEGEASWFREKLFLLKDSLVENIENVVPSPENAFLSGITLGSRSGIPKDLEEKFIATGTIHIVALSGYNISVVAKGIQQFFSYIFSYYTSLSLGAFSVVVFVLMSGAQSTAVRAGIMAILVLFAKATGRTYEISRALFVAGFFMVLWNPMILVHDISFQLSFIATLGIIHLTPIFERLFVSSKKVYSNNIFIKIKLFMVDIVSTTLAAQFAVLPFIVYKMGILSIVSFPINIIILPFIPIAMYLGFAVSLLGFLGDFFSYPFGFIVYKLLELIIWLIEKGSSLNKAFVLIYNFPLWLCLSIYIFMIISFVFYTKKVSSCNKSLQ